MKRTSIKARAARLKSELTAVYYAYRHPGVGPLPKILLALTIGYALSPIDLIPDFIPLLGYLDDFLILPALIALSVKLIPTDVMSECRRRAETEPVTLKKNWITAVIIIIVWMVIAFIVVRLFIT